MLLMLAVVALYSITSLNDKYAVSKCGYSGPQLTFLMAAGTLFFLSFTLKPADFVYYLDPKSYIFILLIVLSKYLEFAMSAKILVDMSVFELKAWLGLTLFMSYFSDVILYGEPLNLLRIVFIILTAGGLVLIAKTGKRDVDYRKIAVPLVFYLLAKFSYGFIMKAGGSTIPSSMTLFGALVILAVIMIPAAKPHLIAKNSPEGMKGMLIVLGCKLPNTLGLLCENRIAAESLSNFSFIQPMILVVMFITNLAGQKSKPDRLAIAGGLCVIAGVFGFQAAKLLLS